MGKKKPVNLNLWTIRFPITAIISILHRVSGFITFLVIPFFLCILSCSLSSQSTFDQLQQTLSGSFTKFLIWGFLSALLYHLIAGIRHMLMDLGFGETKQGGKIGAMSVLIIAAIVIVILGIYLW